MALVTGQAGSNESGNYFARGWMGVFHLTIHHIVCVALTHIMRRLCFKCIKSHPTIRSSPGRWPIRSNAPSLYLFMKPNMRGSMKHDTIV